MSRGVGVTSWPRLGRPCGPVQGVFNLSPLADLRVFIFFLPPGEVRIPAEQMQARWQEAGFSRFPFMALHHPAAGWDLPAAPGALLREKPYRGSHLAARCTSWGAKWISQPK